MIRITWFNIDSTGYNECVKCIIIRNNSVKNTSLVSKYAYLKMKINPSYVEITDVDLENKLVEIDGVKIKLELWDTVG